MVWKARSHAVLPVDQDAVLVDPNRLVRELPLPGDHRVGELLDPLLGQVPLLLPSARSGVKQLVCASGVDLLYDYLHCESPSRLLECPEPPAWGSGHHHGPDG